jgi:hypothetical protein
LRVFGETYSRNFRGKYKEVCEKNKQKNKVSNNAIMGLRTINSNIDNVVVGNLINATLFFKENHKNWLQK